MAIQIIVSFGHAHRIEGFRQGALLPQLISGIQGPLSGEPRGQTPKPIGLVLDYCAICVVINMGTAMLPPDAPASAAPVDVSQVQFSPYAEAVPWTLGHFLFQARAPPFA
jgi:hypothetical protein